MASEQTASDGDFLELAGRACCSPGEAVPRLVLGNAYAAQKIAILYQALPPPLIDGLRKDAKPGGYSDSGADIAFSLRESGLSLVTPAAEPAADRALDWLFPDTDEGIRDALASGATLLWANTVSFEGHPIERLLRETWVVGPHPCDFQRFDDKFRTNGLLRNAGLPVALSILVGRSDAPNVIAFETLDEDALAGNGLRFPLVVKPVRGRGSQGVSVARSLADLRSQVEALISSGRFGDRVIVEEFLEGEELTIAVMPGQPASSLFALPPVRRFDQIADVAPYNGQVPVSRNSAALHRAEREESTVRAASHACVAAAELLDIRSVARIDCRSDSAGTFKLFDLNVKPNLTGAGRPGREEEDSLVALSARAAGWSFNELLRQLLQTAWREA